MALEFISDMSTKALFNSIKAQYKTETGEDLEIGSNEFAIASAVAYVFGGMVERFNDMAANRYIDTARGEYLDALAANLGVDRPHETRAMCTFLVSNQTPSEIIIEKDTVVIDDGNGHEFRPYYGVGEFRRIPAGEIRATLFASVTFDESNNGIKYGTMQKIQNRSDGQVVYYQATTTEGANSNAYPYTPEGDDAFRAIIPSLAARIRSAGSQAYYNAWCRQYSPYILDAYCLVDGDEGFVPGEVRIFVSIDGDGPAGFDAISCKRALEEEEDRPINDFIASVEICEEQFEVVKYELYYDPMKMGYALADEIARNACDRLRAYYMQNIGLDVSIQRFNELVAAKDTNKGIVSVEQFAQVNGQLMGNAVFPVPCNKIASRRFEYEVIAKVDE